MDQLISGKSLLFGFLIWLTPFVVGFFTFPVKDKWPLTFKTIMAVVLTIATVYFTRNYFVEIRPANAMEGLSVGLLWAAICIVIDVPIFVFGFKMRVVQYFHEVGLAYLMVPAITWGSASLLELLTK